MALQTPLDSWKAMLHLVQRVAPFLGHCLPKAATPPWHLHDLALFFLQIALKYLFVYFVVPFGAKYNELP